MKRLITFSLLLTPEIVLSPFDRLEGYERNGFHKVLFDEKPAGFLLNILHSLIPQYEKDSFHADDCPSGR